MKATFRALLLAAAGAAALSACGVSKASGVEAFKNGEYAAALEILRPFAERGDAEAQRYLAEVYFYGWGVPENDAEALKWSRLAAEQGSAMGMALMMNIYELGKGVPRDDVEARNWYRRMLTQQDADLLLAANRGDVKSQFELGVQLFSGSRYGRLTQTLQRITCRRTSGRPISGCP